MRLVSSGTGSSQRVAIGTDTARAYLSSEQRYGDRIVINCMGDQTTITLERADKERLDEGRGSVPWGTYLVGLLEEQENEPVRIDSAQLEELSRMTAERTIDLLEERRY